MIPPDHTEWDVTQLADRVKNTRPRQDWDSAFDDQQLAKYFSQAHLGHFNEPATILDQYGRIMVWYLPDIFLLSRIVSLKMFII